MHHIEIELRLHFLRFCKNFSTASIMELAPLQPPQPEVVVVVVVFYSAAPPPWPAWEPKSAPKEPKLDLIELKKSNFESSSSRV